MRLLKWYLETKMSISQWYKKAIFWLTSPPRVRTQVASTPAKTGIGCQDSEIGIISGHSSAGDDELGLEDLHDLATLIDGSAHDDSNAAIRL